MVLIALLKPSCLRPRPEHRKSKRKAPEEFLQQVLKPFPRKTESAGKSSSALEPGGSDQPKAHPLSGSSSEGPFRLVRTRVLRARHTPSPGGPTSLPLISRTPRQHFTSVTIGSIFTQRCQETTNVQRKTTESPDFTSSCKPRVHG